MATPLTPEPADRVAVFHVRATTESGVAPVLRITRTLDVRELLTLVTTTTDPDDACEVLRGWVADFAARGEAGPPGHSGEG